MGKPLALIVAATNLLHPMRAALEERAFEPCRSDAYLRWRELSRVHTARPTEESGGTRAWRAEDINQ